MKLSSADSYSIPRFLQGGTHRHQVAGLADDLERFAHVVDVLSARVEDSEG